MPMEVETAKSARLGVWDKKNADDLSLIWDHSLLTKDKNATVDVNLIGYMETRKTVNNYNKNQFHLLIATKMAVVL